MIDFFVYDERPCTLSTLIVFTVVPCSTPEVVANAEIVSNTGFLPGGGSVTYKCSTGYKLTGGQLTLMCNLGGIWNYSKPQCTRKLILFVFCFHITFIDIFSCQR